MSSVDPLVGVAAQQGVDLHGLAPQLQAPELRLADSQMGVPQVPELTDAEPQEATDGCRTVDSALAKAVLLHPLPKSDSLQYSGGIHSPRPSSRQKAAAQV